MLFYYCRCQIQAYITGSGISIADSSIVLLSMQGFTEEEAKKAVEGHPDALPEAVKAVNTSADKETNYAVIAGIVGAIAIGYWYFSSSSPSKKEKDDKE